MIEIGNHSKKQIVLVIITFSAFTRKTIDVNQFVEFYLRVGTYKVINFGNFKPVLA